MLWKLITGALRTDRRGRSIPNPVQADAIGALVSSAPRSPAEEVQRLVRDGLLEAALTQCRTWVQNQPNDIGAHVEMANVLSDLWSLEDAFDAYGRAANLAPSASVILSSLLFHSHYLASPDPERIFALHRRFGDVTRDKIFPRGGQAKTVWDPDRRLRIGYMSPNFSRHSVGYFAEPVIRHHDRSRLEVYCYYNHPASDDATQRFQQLADVWRPIADVSDDAVEQSIREDRIDILVDLAGHSKMNRLELFARKPAPIQITWLGYPDTTGLDAMDYRITDAVADPYDDAERRHTEQLLRIDDGFLCYQPPDDSPSACGRSAQNVVFASCNNLAKLNEPLIRVWGQILARVPGSRLILKSKQLASADVKNRVIQCFERSAVDIDRIELKGWIAERSHHLDYYREVDIALDTFPYNGTTTTCEALWMGVPVVTRAGRVHMSRVGASILQCVGLKELVAASEDEYIAIAVALAHAHDRRHVLRTSMRSRLTRSSLLDHAGFTSKLEQQFRKCWIKECLRQTGKA